MNIFGIGPLEFTLIVFIALIILGPNDMVKAGRTLGHWMRKIIMSPEWKTVQNTSRELRTLPNRLIREAGIEETQKSIQKQMNGIHEVGKELNDDLRNIESDLSSWVTPDHNISTLMDDMDTQNTNTPKEIP